jgi:hypothetical protein
MLIWSPLAFPKDGKTCEKLLENPTTVKMVAFFLMVVYEEPKQIYFRTIVLTQFNGIPLEK